MENKEWMMVDGKFVEADHTQFKKTIQRASKKQIEEVALKLFEQYMRKF
jgi:intein-encoded DNA endonuclease-like protein